MNIENRRRQIKYVAVTAMLAALSTVVLAIGSIVDVLDLSLAAFASLLLYYAVIEMNRGWGLALYAVTSVVALILLPQKSPAVLYACFIGYYPVLKSVFERFKKPLQWTLKLLSVHAGMALIYGCARLFLPSLLEGWGGQWLLLLSYFLILVAFITYDIASSMLISYYCKVLQKHLRLR